MRFLPLVFLIILLNSCEKTEKNPADEIIDKAIKQAGGEKYNNAEIEFLFRNVRYTSARKNGTYEFTRTISDSTQTQYFDVLNNEGFKRFEQGEQVSLSDSLSQVYAQSVNAVHYFVQLPYGLNDEAVEKKLIGKDSIDGNEYFEIEVTFQKTGGGVDHEDIYMYWINTESYTIDYLAYRFFVDGGGIRFRKAENPRIVEGIRFVDYQNYKTDKLSTPLEKLDDLFQADQLVKVSQINNKIIKVSIQE